MYKLFLYNLFFVACYFIAVVNSNRIHNIIYHDHYYYYRTRDTTCWHCSFYYILRYDACLEEVLLCKKLKKRSSDAIIRHFFFNWDILLKLFINSNTNAVKSLNHNSDN